MFLFGDPVKRATKTAVNGILHPNTWNDALVTLRQHEQYLYSDLARSLFDKARPNPESHGAHGDAMLTSIRITYHDVCVGLVTQARQIGVEPAWDGFMNNVVATIFPGTSRQTQVGIVKLYGARPEVDELLAVMDQHWEGLFSALAAPSLNEHARIYGAPGNEYWIAVRAFHKLLDNVHNAWFSYASRQTAHARLAGSPDRVEVAKLFATSKRREILTDAIGQHLLTSTSNRSLSRLGSEATRKYLESVNRSRR